MEDETMTTAEDILPAAEETTAEVPAENTEATTETAEEMPVDNTAELEELRAYKERNQAANAELIKLLKLNPTLVKTIQMMKEGATFEEAVARNIDLSALPVEGDPDYEKWSQSAKMREEEYNKGLEFENTLAQNKAKSQENLRAFAEENNLSEEQAMQFVETVVSPLLDQIATLDLSKEFLTNIYKGVNHETKVAEAKEEGKMEGMNAKIEETMMTPPPAGDGLPKGAGSVAVAEKPQKPMSYIDKLKQK